MIPKIIHYCWFGESKIPPLIQKCIKSWKKHLPDYEFKLWNEENFNVNSTLWTQHAYELKKYAFVSDYVRLKALYEYGRIYLDTDIKILKSFNPLLKNEGFIGFEDVKGNVIASCVIAAKQLHPFIQECMQYYNQDFTIEIINKNEANVIDITQRLIKKGMQLGGGEQVINEMHIYPREYFCPMDFWGNWNKTANTYCIHLFNGSWLPDSEMKKLNKRKTWYFKLCKWIYVHIGLQKLKSSLKR